MIEIINKIYDSEIDWTIYRVKFTYEDYQISFGGKFHGDFTEQELLDKLQTQYDAWIFRIG